MSAEEKRAADTGHRLIQMTLDNPQLRVASTVLDPETKKITLYSAADASTVESILAKYDLTGDVNYAHAARSVVELNAAIHELIGEYGELPSGHQVAKVIPSADASRIELVLDETASTRSALRLPDVGLEIEVSYGERPVAAQRNHAPTTQYPQRFSGAYMQNGASGCTTGYRLTQQGTNTPGMGSAHHCGITTSSQWYYSTLTSWLMGVRQGGLYPGGASYGDTALWTGTGTGQMVPGIFVGNNTVGGSSLQQIKGAVSTSVGQSICYSGSFSGTVCGNVVQATNMSVCYGAPYPCYYNLAETTQAVGTPAAGQGDSGGPAYFVGGPGNGIYAAGVISGISNGTTTCTGDGGGRLCSSAVIYAPITEFFGANWALNYYP